MPKIFVQIAAYRDPELLSTIKHCLERAVNPENLTFGIAYQDEVFLDLYDSDPRFKIIKIPYKDSQGACWARHKTNELYNREDFTLQIDSHMRFIPNWDHALLQMWKDLKDPKAVLTSYPAQYEPQQEEKDWKTEPHICNVHNFKDGQTEQRPKSVNLLKRDTPFQAIHVAAGFIFGPGSIITDVPYDPEFYFLGEETALTVRLYTHGYNLFHPHRIILYHHYERKEQPKHWSDDKEWGKKSNLAKERLDCLLGRSTKHDLGKYTLGNVRTLEEFQNYSGIDYKRKIVHLDTIEGKEPPVDLTDTKKWSYEMKTYKKIVQWNYDKIDKCEDPRFWAMIFKDQNDQELHRVDILHKDNSEIIDGKVREKEFEFKYYTPAQIPSTFLIWPYSESKQWLTNTKWQICA